MGVRAENSTNYSHSDEPNLLNLHKAMEYNAAGQPIIRTQLGGVNSPVTDAFGRLRTSNPVTLFDSFNRYKDSGLFSTYTSGTASASFESNKSTIAMTVNGTSGASVVRESNRVFAYQPGKSLQILSTFCMNSAKTNLVQRVGYFNASNGVFLERDGSTVSFVIRSNTSGTPQEDRVNQSNWNVNTLLGSSTNPTVLNLDLTQILFIDIEWLGVGSVRCGFVINGQFVVCHVFNHANQIGNTLPYMTTACLPVRYEITNSGTTGSSSTLRQICSTVISEGGYELTGVPQSAGHSLNSSYTLSSQYVLYPIFSMRLKSTNLDAIVLPQDYSLGLTGNTNYRYVIYKGATVNYGTWIDAGSNSSVEYNLTSNGFTGGTVIESGYIISSNQSSGNPGPNDLPFRYQLERWAANSTAQTFTICVETVASNSPSAYCAVTWEELT